MSVSNHSGVDVTPRISKPALAPIPQRNPWRDGLFNALLFGVWLWLYHPLFHYFSIIFSDRGFRTNQLLLFIILALLLLQIRQGGLGLRLRDRPQLAWLPLCLAIGGSVGYLLIERYLAINIVASSFFFGATYGLVGLWMEPTRWRQGLPAALLLIGALPFGDHMQTFIGYPMRIATAKFVGVGFHAIGVGSIGLETILTFENGIAHVDLPCSGVKSLWTGTLFLIAVTWIERHPFNVRWLLIAALFATLLFMGNLLRVALLIGIGVVGQMALVAELMHVPLGVLTFAAACGTALWFVRHRDKPDSAARSSYIASDSTALIRPLWLSPTLLLAIGIMVLLYQPRLQAGLTAAPPAWSFAPTIATTAEPLSADEIWWLTKDGAESADRRRFQWGDHSGSMLLITSSTWRAHHRPERCFEVKGFAVNVLRTHLVNPELPIQVVTLRGDTGQRTHNAVYWFQSANQITADYGTRMWADVAFQRQRWVLVALLFDDDRAPDSKELAPFYEAMAEAVALGLQ